ncbi:MAG: stage III sporulation protein AB [Clostridia bacterium]|nr:stage III sporulation protein AB [Clostridia bacterium]
MILRYLADALVILGCGYIGILLAGKMDGRIRQLEGLEQMLSQLAFNIGFLSLPLKDAILRTAESQQGIIQSVLRQVSGLMQRFPHMPLREVWEESVRYCQAGLCLEDEDYAALFDFAAHIGQGDVGTELNNIRLTSAKLKLSVEQAREKRKKDGKLCKGLGFLTGMLIVLLLA